MRPAAQELSACQNLLHQRDIPREVTTSHIVHLTMRAVKQCAQHPPPPPLPARRASSAIALMQLMFMVAASIPVLTMLVAHHVLKGQQCHRQVCVQLQGHSVLAAALVHCRPRCWQCGPVWAAQVHKARQRPHHTLIDTRASGVDHQSTAASAAGHQELQQARKQNCYGLTQLWPRPQVGPLHSQGRSSHSSRTQRQLRRSVRQFRQKLSTCSATTMTKMVTQRRLRPQVHAVLLELQMLHALQAQSEVRAVHHKGCTRVQARLLKQGQWCGMVARRLCALYELPVVQQTWRTAQRCPRHHKQARNIGDKLHTQLSSLA